MDIGLLIAGFFITMIVFGLLNIVTSVRRTPGTGGGKKNKMFKYNFGYIGLIIILLVGLGLGGAVNSMM